MARKVGRRLFVEQSTLAALERLRTRGGAVVTDPELHLYGADVREVAEALELMLRFRRRNGYAPRGERSRVAAEIALAVPLVAACLPALLTPPGRKQPPQSEPRSAARPQAPRPAVRLSWDAHSGPARGSERPS